MGSRGTISCLFLALAGILASACALAPPATPRVDEVSGQTTADARISTTSPLIVEWPAAERGRLESALLKGPVAVRYQGAELELVSECRRPGTYQFVPMVPKSEHLVFGSALDLDASFPLGAARLGARLEAGRQLELTTRLVGRWELEAQPSEAPAERTCDGATHMIAAATVGAFRLYSSTSANSGAGAKFEGAASVSGGSSHERSVVNSDGSPDKCAAGSAQGPPTGCGALIRLELSPFGSQTTKLLQELGTLDFTPIDKRSSGVLLEHQFESAPFSLELCAKIENEVYGSRRKAVSKYCAAVEATEGRGHTTFPRAEDVDALRKELESSRSPFVELLLLDAQIRSERAARSETIERLQALADEKTMETDIGYFARYLLAGCGDAEVEERNLREILHHPRLSAEPWPRMRLARHMLSRDRAHAIALAQSARSLAPMCAEERLSILDWLGSEGAAVLSSGELFDIQLDAVLTLSGQGMLPSTSPLGRRAIQTHDYQTWDSSKSELERDQWALGALYWAEGAECLYRGNTRCAARQWQELLERAPHSPYVAPAYSALLRVTGKSEPARLASLAKLRPELQPGSAQRKAIAEQPSCGPLSDEQLQRVLDEAQELAVLHADQLRKYETNWEVDSLSALAPDLSECAQVHPSNGKPRLLTLRIDPNDDKRPVQVTPADQSLESRHLAKCVKRRAAGNASLFSTPFSVTIRITPSPRISFDHGQGWAGHVRERFSCTAGDDDACLRLGRAWLRGDEVPREVGQALAIFSAKCGEGNQEACVEEAVLRRSEPPASRSRTLLTNACDRGHGRACRLLLSIKPARIRPRIARMHELLTQACSSPVGDAAACVELWYAHQEGTLPPLSAMDAQKLLTTACALLGHGTVDGPCSTPAELMASYPHQAGGDLGRLTCAHGIWQGCESAFIDAAVEERPTWAEAGCKAGSPDACAWLADEAPALTEKRIIELMERTIKLCEEHEDSGHESVCQQLPSLRAHLRVLKWEKRPRNTSRK